MASGLVTIKVTGAKEVGAMLQHLQKLPKDLTKQWKDIDKILRHEWANNFNTESANGKPWANLTEATQKRRIRAGYPPARPILTNTGALSMGAFGKNMFNVREISKQKLVSGVSAPYAQAMQFGHPNWKNKVGRPFITVSNDAASRILGVFNKAIDKAIRKKV